MSDETTDGLRDRLARQSEDALGKLAAGAAREPADHRRDRAAFTARERAAQAQEVAMGALNLPSAADLERLTRRVRSVVAAARGHRGRRRSARREARPPPAMPSTTAEIEPPRRDGRSTLNEVDASLSALRGARSAAAKKPAPPQARRRRQPAARSPPRRASGGLGQERRERARGRRAATRPRGLDARSRAAGAERVADREQARGARPRGARRPQHRGGLHLDGERPGRAPRARRAPGRGRRRDRSRRPAAGVVGGRRASAAVSRGSAATASSAPSARLVPSSASASATDERSPRPRPGSSAPQVPTRMARVDAEVAQLLHARSPRSARPSRGSGS